tara:strand:- start:1291 stop:1791 length:501 start_codon:yes stop_codon:yes gene_type:complete
MEPAFVSDDSVAPLRLRAEDVQDLMIISACLQDAVTRQRDMTYRPREQRFAIVFNRFRWEREAVTNGQESLRGRSQRIRTGVHFDGCLAVKSKGLDVGASSEVLSLLAIEYEPFNDGAAEIVLRFAGEAAIRMHLECIDCQLRDMTEPWEARTRPDHQLDDPAGDT